MTLGLNSCEFSYELRIGFLFTSIRRNSMQRFFQIGLGVTLLFVAAVVGCGSKPAPPQMTKAEMEAEKAKTIETALAKLSPEDRALAVSQKICPVSDEPLGSMGTPIVMEVSGRKVLICCDSCRQHMVDEAEKYLAKLPAPAEATAVPETK
jgi:hypothetical protein